MKMFFDSSAFAKRYVEEDGSVREGSLSCRQWREAKARLSTEVADATIVNLVPPVVADAIAIKVLESNAARTLDTLHVGCSLQWNAELFATLDERQLREAERANLRTKKVRTGQQRNRLDRRSVRSSSLGMGTVVRHLRLAGFPARRQALVPARIRFAVPSPDALCS